MSEDFERFLREEAEDVDPAVIQKLEGNLEVARAQGDSQAIFDALYRLAQVLSVSRSRAHMERSLPLFDQLRSMTRLPALLLDCWYYQAKVEYRLGHYSDCTKSCENMLRLVPQHSQALALLALANKHVNSDATTAGLVAVGVAAVAILGAVVAGLSRRH